MFLEITLATLLFVSLFGISFILFKKISILVKLSEVGFPKNSIVAIIKSGLKKIPGAQKFDCELYLQKMLSRIRVLTIKAESKTGNWLERLRKRRNGHNNHNNEYWEELKKAKDGK